MAGRGSGWGPRCTRCIFSQMSCSFSFRARCLPICFSWPRLLVLLYSCFESWWSASPCRLVYDENQPLSQKKWMVTNGLGAERRCCSEANNGIYIVSEGMVLVRVIIVFLFNGATASIISVERGLFSLFGESTHATAVFSWSLLCMWADFPLVLSQDPS